MSAPHWTHVTQTLCTDGSPINTVIKELTRQAANAGISSSVVGSDNRGYHFPHAQLAPVDFNKYLDREYLLRREVHADAVSVRLGGSRRNLSRMIGDMVESISTTTGPVIVHDGYYGAAILDLIKREHPDRPAYLYVHAAPSRSYTSSEFRRYVAECEAVICVSDAMRDKYAARLRNDDLDHKLVTVLNGVDADRYYPDTSVGDVPRILFAGTTNEIKGPHLLAQALGRLGHRQFRATFLGSSAYMSGLRLSPYEQRLRQQVGPVADRVTFAAYAPRDEMPRRYRDHDILVVPSQFDDPCPLVLLEGLASGLAVVCSGRGGMPEVGRDAVQYASTVDELTEALDALLTDDALRSSFQKRARVRAEELSWGRAFGQLHEIVGA